MKKVCIIVLFVALATLAFAQQGLSVGARAGYAPIWETWRYTSGSNWYQAEYTGSGFGAQVFVDAKYVEASLGYFGNSANYTYYYSNSSGSKSSNSGSDGTHGSWLSLAVLGKYPFAIGSFTLFPLAGFEYDLNLSYTDKSSLSSEDKAALNYLWVKAGVGADFPLSDKLYLRPTAVAGLKFHSQADADEISSSKDSGYTETITWIRLDIGVAVGYKL